MGDFFPSGFGAFLCPRQNKYFDVLVSFQKPVCIIHPDALSTKGEDLMVKKQEKWDWEKRIWARGGLHVAVTTTNKYFIGLLCGSGYTRSSRLTVSRLDAGFSELRDWGGDKFHRWIVLLFWSEIQCQIWEASARCLLGWDLLVSSCFLHFLWKQKQFGHFIYMRVCVCVCAHL